MWEWENGSKYDFDLFGCPDCGSGLFWAGSELACICGYLCSLPDGTDETDVAYMVAGGVNFSDALDALDGWDREGGPDGSIPF